MRRLLILIASLSLLLGLTAVSPATAADWREYNSGGRRWREKCEAYSSTVERCRTEIWATKATWTGRTFVTRNGWTFNNLLYKPSPREQWKGNPLGTTGEYVIAGRRWKTECDTAWTGRGGCRSQIWAKVPAFNGRYYRFVEKWVFNNEVQFLNHSAPAGPNTVITPTTLAEVKHTYRRGCPVPPNELRTIRINQWGMDGKVHRGEIIVRADLANRVAGIFEDVFRARFPIGQMRNPNVWSGDDIKMMKANNTSAFNCRRVVGNPTAQSPHSRGIAVDVNPVQNPYRDPRGTWHPSSKYSVNRPANVPGLHTASSASVRAFESRRFRWYKVWDWHHFQYTGGGSARTMNRSGGLEAQTLPQLEGWESDVNTVDPAIKGTDALAIGCADTSTDAPAPISAIEGILSADGKPGVSVAMQFASEGEAQDYFSAWTSQMRACSGESTTELSATDDTWLGRWDVDGTNWSEAGGLRRDTVKLTLLDADLTAAELGDIAADF